ncbi:MAG: sigma-70 family RNA polymerase sigma factor [Christensenellaceae bacterium]|nr:sigma-70 family RNA polymerase sigma factor [Christensenellaceae bacterium]
MMNPLLFIPFAILAIEDDDDRAFMERLYIEYKGLMYGVALSYLRNSEDAQDAVNDAIIRLIDKISELREKDRSVLRPYIVSTMKRTALNVIKKKKNVRERVRNADIEELEAYADQKAQVDAAVIMNSTSAALRKAVEQLTDREKTVLRLRYFEEWSDAEIAQWLGLSESSIRVYLVRARRHMYEILKWQGFEDEG